MNTNQLQIKVHRIYKFVSDQPLKAFVDISINEAIIIKGIKIIDGKSGLFVSMPQEKAKNENRWYSTVRCIDKELEAHIALEVLTAYQASLN